MSHKFEIDIASLEETLSHVGNKPQKKTNEKDPRQFRPTIKNDKKEYHAEIRLLPQGLPTKGAVKPYFVERWTHSFQENGMWYFANCPSLLNKQNKTREHECPVCVANRSDYDSKQEVLISRAKGRKVKKAFCTNILVIDDPQCPENNGKVMYWNMPVEIYNMIELKRKPTSPRKQPSTPYCPVKGYDLDLILKFNPASGYPSYDGSDWLDPRPLADSDEEIVEILSKTFDLSEFEGPSIYKSYDELNARFVKVTSGGIVASAQGTANVVYAEDVAPTDAPPRRTKPEVSSISVSSAKPPVEESAKAPAEEDSTDWLD